jgi:peptide deformylase
MAPYRIRQYGDPVLRHRAAEVTDIDGSLAKLADDMIATMYDAPGVGLAAPQVGVQKRIFVYDAGEGPRTIINPTIVDSDGEWTYEEGCLSIPGLSFELMRPARVHLVGLDLDGNEVSIEADELEGRAFQHEVDHLDGVLFVERLDEEQRKAARKAMRELVLSRGTATSGDDGDGGGGLHFG